MSAIAAAGGRRRLIATAARRVDAACGPVALVAAAFAAAAALAAVAGAQDAVPSSGADSPDSAEYFSAAPVTLGRLHLAPYGDLRVRDDDLTHRPLVPPTRLDDVHRQRVTLRGGLGWAPAGAPVQAGAGVRLSLGSDHNQEDWSVFQNETPDTVEADRLDVRFTTPRGDELVAGKLRSPLRLSELLWDDDLRPVGAAFTARARWLEQSVLRLGLAWYARSRFDFEDGRVGVLQFGATLGEDAATGAEAVISGLRFLNMRVPAGDGLARQNATVAVPGGRDYVTHYEPVDLAVAGHAAVGRVPVSARVEVSRNRASRLDRDAVRTRLSAGGPGAPAGAELGWIYQRVEREALPGAFNSDDWWNHSRMRGNQVWLLVGAGRPVSLKIAGFVERRDDLSRDTRRLITELRARLPGS